MNNKTQWSWLVYMGADNDLDTDAQADLDEMATADRSKVQLVVQVDHLDKPTDRKQLVEGHKLNLLPQVLGRDGKDANSRNPIVVSSFLRFAQGHAPSERRAVVLWSHGAGFQDFTFEGVDGPRVTNRRPLRRRGRTIDTYEESASRFLSNPSLGRALKIASNGHPFDIIGSDSCLMAMVEVAHQIRETGTIFVASQNNIRRTGWNYRNILARFNGNHAPEDVAAFIFDDGRQQGDTTISAIRLNRMDDVADALDRLGDALLPLLEIRRKAIGSARDQVRHFPRLGFIDLYHFAELLNKELKEHDVVYNATNAVMDVVQKAVIHPIPQKVSGDAHGLTVYVPTLPFPDQERSFNDLSLIEKAPQWARFVHAHSKM